MFPEKHARAKAGVDAGFSNKAPTQWRVVTRCKDGKIMLRKTDLNQPPARVPEKRIPVFRTRTCAHARTADELTQLERDAENVR
jgi:hypothetical protein